MHKYTALLARPVQPEQWDLPDLLVLPDLPDLLVLPEQLGLLVQWGLPAQLVLLPRQYMHNKENAVTMRLSAH